LNELQKIGRLALRVEGTMWCAYYAMPDTMDGAHGAAAPEPSSDPAQAR
jgi:hypothetical protein